MKKALSLLTVSAMAVSMLAGCGSSKPAETTAAATTAAAAETTAAATEAASEAATEAAAAATDADLSDKKVGVCIYQFSDNFMTLFRNELQNYLVSLGFKAENIEIMDGANDQATQTNQIQNFITKGVDCLIINPVNSSSAATITDMVTAANIPLVYINREPDAQEEQRWADENMKVCYVGCDARQSGTMQGEIIADLDNHGDINGDGKVSYIMIEGERRCSVQNRVLCKGSEGCRHRG